MGDFPFRVSHENVDSVSGTGQSFRMTFTRIPRAPTETDVQSSATRGPWGGLSVSSDFQLIQPISIGPNDISHEIVTAESVVDAIPSIASNRLSVDNSSATYVQNVPGPLFFFFPTTNMDLSRNNAAMLAAEIPIKYFTYPKHIEICDRGFTYRLHSILRY